MPSGLLFAARPLFGYLTLGGRTGSGQTLVQVLGESLPQSAACRCHWCGSLMACDGVDEGGLSVTSPFGLITDLRGLTGCGKSAARSTPAPYTGGCRGPATPRAEW